MCGNGLLPAPRHGGRGGRREVADGRGDGAIRHGGEQGGKRSRKRDIAAYHVATISCPIVPPSGSKSEMTGEKQRAAETVERGGKRGRKRNRKRKGSSRRERRE